MMRYYDLKRNWTRKIVPHLNDEKLNKILVRDFNRFTWGRWRQHFTAGMFPEDFESCDWRCEHRGTYPRFWRYCKHAACHWIVNFTLRLAMLAEPKKTWRIISSDEHSAVWNGDELLFDFNFLALGISAEECFEAAMHGNNHREFEVGEYMTVYLADHWKTEQRKNTPSKV